MTQGYFEVTEEWTPLGSLPAKDINEKPVTITVGEGNTINLQTTDFSNSVMYWQGDKPASKTNVNGSFIIHNHEQSFIGVDTSTIYLKSRKPTKVSFIIVE